MSDSCDVTYSEMKHKTKATHYQNVSHLMQPVFNAAYDLCVRRLDVVCKLALKSSPFISQHCTSSVFPGIQNRN